METHRQKIVTLHETVGGIPYTVPDVVVDEYYIQDDQGEWYWEETYSCESMHKIEQAIEKVYPGWFHRCMKDGKRLKVKCDACERERLDRS